MTDTTANPAVDSLVAFWKNRYNKQQRLIASITSLLQRYGSSLDIDGLHSAFLLTLMGHYVTTETCYFDAQRDQLVPARTYGRTRVNELTPIPMDSDLVTHIVSDGLPKVIRVAPGRNLPVASRLIHEYRVAAPLLLKERLIGVVFLGPRVSGQKYTDLDLQVLSSLCAVTATAFNNANLYRNARRAAEEVGKLYNVRSDIISRITHEFQTPLTVIKASMDVMPKTDGSEQWREPINNSVTRLEELINSLLHLNRDDSQLVKAPQHCNAVSVIEERMKHRLEDATLRNITFAFNRRSSADEYVACVDQANLSFAVDALLDNALKFSPVAGTVGIEIDVTSEPPGEVDGICLRNWLDNARELLDSYAGLTVDTRRDSDGKDWRGTPHIVIRVKDNGIGIPSNELAVVSEPFRQGSNTPDSGVRGRGLGLSIVQKIVTQVRGCLYVRSAEGEGTTVTILIPAKLKNR